jgi:ABC-2 type transport system ATP-binding protein
MAVIETEKLTKYYGKYRGIDGVSLSVNEGEIYGFIGPNGAGKSTMIKTLLNFLYPTSGSARIFGLDCASQSHLIKKQTAYVPAETRFYDELTVQDLLDYSGRFYSPKADADEWIRRFDMEPKKKIGQLSTGNKKKVSLAAAMACRPKLLILDEPTSGLDPLVRQTLFEALRELQSGGSTVFLSSHNLDEVQSLCDRVAIIRDGHIADVRTLNDLTKNRAKKVTVMGSSLPVVFDGQMMKLVSRGEGRVVFTYHSADMAALLKLLAAMEISDLLVEDIALSDIFMSYYTGKEVPQ